MMLWGEADEAIPSSKALLAKYNPSDDEDKV